jgi:hypothetical protein
MYYGITTALALLGVLIWKGLPTPEDIKAFMNKRRG